LKPLPGNIFFGPFLEKMILARNPKSLDQAGWSKPRNARLNSREMELLQLTAQSNATKETAT
jgi:hypothetical protein